MVPMSGISLEGDVVVITGAGGGLGRAHALEVARRGASVVVNDVGGSHDGLPAPADSVVAEIEAAGGEAVASKDSVATPEGGRAIIDTAIGRFGTVDAVVHNAGVWRHVPFEEMTAENLDAVLDVHLRGAFFVTRPAWSTMVAKGHGRIVLTSSAAGAFGREEGANYVAAKAGLLGLGRALAIEGGALGIRTNCLLPIAPYIRRPRPDSTAGSTSMSPAAVERFRQAAVPTSATPEVVSPIVAYLVSRACGQNGRAYSAGGGHFARVFTGLTSGWTGAEGVDVEAEDIAAHIEQIDDPASFTTPGSAWEELSQLGATLSGRAGPRTERNGS
jgi:NAD(P)-dependent dehydrogenase (short-subunit alcohol dehydrogenase family)